MTAAPIPLFYICPIRYQIPLQNLAATVLTSTRTRLTHKEILLCFLGSGIFILIGTLFFKFPRAQAAAAAVSYPIFAR